ATPEPAPKPKPNPSMMARHRKLRSRYVPLPNEVWASAGEQNPYDIGQQYAVWWFDNAASEAQKDNAHLLSGGGLPPEIDRPLLQFACDTLHEYTLTEAQRVGLRDGFHSGIRGIMLRGPRAENRPSACMCFDIRMHTGTTVEHNQASVTGFSTAETQPDALSPLRTIVHMLATGAVAAVATVTAWFIMSRPSLPAYNTSYALKALSSVGSVLVILFAAASVYYV